MAFPADQALWDIKRAGKSAILVKTDADAADDAKPWEGSSTPGEDVRQTLKCKFKAVSQSDIDGDRVLDSDQMVLIYAPDVTGRAPGVGDKIIDGSDTLTIKRRATKSYKGVAYRYDLLVGR